MKIGYFADGPWSHKALDKLLADQNLEIAFICARHDNPDSNLKEIAKEQGLDFLSHPRVNSSDFYELMCGYRCDLFVSMSFNQIFRESMINLPTQKTINCHAGKLPFYRGRNVLNWALINDECEFGITVHYVDEGIDTGDIILQRCYPITDEDNYATLLDRAYEGCADCLYGAVRKIMRGEVLGTPQATIAPFGFYCTARKLGDERLVWNQSSREIFNFVRAICRPGPEARTFFGGGEIRINRVEFLAGAPVYKNIPGTIIGVESDSFLVKTADSYIRVLEWSGYENPLIGDRLQ
jgi:methionyl-tRNA formyltransferase